MNREGPWFSVPGRWPVPLAGAFGNRRKTAILAPRREHRKHGTVEGGAFAAIAACTILSCARKLLGLKGFWGGVALLGVHSGRLVHGSDRKKHGTRTT